MPDNTTTNKVAVSLPAGLTAEQVQKIVDAYLPKQQTNSKRNQAKREAVGMLVKAHATEFNKYLTEAKKRHGLPVD
jgi:hypothetical protein